jgi:hypothetical protein
VRGSSLAFCRGAVGSDVPFLCDSFHLVASSVDELKLGNGENNQRVARLDSS